MALCLVYVKKEDTWSYQLRHDRPYSTLVLAFRTHATLEQAATRFEKEICERHRTVTVVIEKHDGEEVKRKHLTELELSLIRAKLKPMIDILKEH
jgi:hypothetical protein